MPLNNSKSEKEQFARRLHLALDQQGIPRRGRQTRLGKMFGVSQKASGKWLSADAIPSMERSIEIAKALDVPLEWLLTGRGPMALEMQESSLSNRELALLNKYRAISAEQRDALHVLIDAITPHQSSPQIDTKK